MNIEEKARAYDEALERANKQRADYQKELDKTDKNSHLAEVLRAGICAIDMALPELTESEDERIRKALIEGVRQIRCKGDVTQEQMITYLEKQKEQKPAEWGEEDEEMLNSCISSIEESKENRYAYKENDGDTSYDREIAWLKSLRPQPHWKPSEEQMTALERTIHLSNFGTEENRRKALGSLYEQLKKLGAKEEPEYYQHFDPDC